MMLQAIKFAFLEESYGSANFYTIIGMILCQILLILWWLINFVIINALGPHLSIAMIILEVLNTLATLWFFVIIVMKASDVSSFTMVCNPLVIII